MGCEVYFNNLPKEEIDKIREENKKNIRIADFERAQYVTRYEILFNLKSIKIPKQLINKIAWYRIDTLYGYILFNIIHLGKIIEQEFDVDFVKSYDNNELYFCGRQYAINQNYVDIDTIAKVYTNNILDSILNNKKLNLEEIICILDEFQSEARENRTHYYLNKFNEYKEIDD